jgi:hypothetical protein
MEQQESTYEEIVKKINEKRKENGLGSIVISRTKLGFCKNDGCNVRRRHASAYCSTECPKRIGILSAV